MIRFAFPLLLLVPSLVEAQPITRFVNDQTLFYARLNVAALDAGSLVDMIGPLLIDEPDTLKAFRTALLRERQRFLDAGGSELQVVYGVDDFPDPPCVFVPLKGFRPELEAWIRDVAFSGIKTNSVAMEGFRVIGPIEAVKRIQDRVASPRPELVAAFQPDAIAQWLVAPGKDVRRTYREIVRDLPPDLGITSDQLADGVQSMSLMLLPTPSAKVRLVIDTKEEATATVLEKLIPRGVKLVGGLPSGEAQATIEKMYPKLPQKLIEWFTPERQGKQVIVERELKVVFAELRQVMPPPSGEEFDRRETQNRMKQIGLALHNYYDAHGRLPRAYFKTLRV